VKRKALAVLVIVVAGIAAFGGKVLATNSTGGYAGSTLANATFAELHLSAHTEGPDPWSVLLKTHEQSDVYVQTNDWPQNGSSTGWHTHPGPSLIILNKGGILTDYEFDGTSCTKVVYDATNGDVGFLDPGGPGHAHMLVNTGPGDASTYAVQFIPKGATRKIDVTPAPQGPGCDS
jgi:hypothetical protein